MPKIRVRSKAEIEEDIRKERRQIEELQSSIIEWQTTIEDLQKDAGSKDDHQPHTEDNNEWHTRYESQVECNKILESQLSELRVKITQEQAKLKTITDGGELEEFKGANAQRTLIRLKREKQDLESQLRDYQWRLDREAQTYFKVDEKRKALLLDTAKAGQFRTKRNVEVGNCSQEPSFDNNSHVRPSPPGNSYVKLQRERNQLTKHGKSDSKNKEKSSGKIVKLPPIIREIPSSYQKTSSFPK